MEYAEIIVHRQWVKVDEGSGRALYTYEWKGSKNAPALVDMWVFQEIADEFPLPWPLKIISTDYSWARYTVIRKDANLPLGWYYIAKEKIMHKTSVLKYRIMRTAEIWGLRKKR